MKRNILLSALCLSLLCLSINSCRKEEAKLTPKDDYLIKQSLGIMSFSDDPEGDEPRDAKIMQISESFGSRGRIIYKGALPAMLVQSFYPPIAAKDSQPYSGSEIKSYDYDKVDTYVDLLLQRYFNYFDHSKTPANLLPKYMLLFDYVNTIWASHYWAPMPFMPYATDFKTSFLQANLSSMQRQQDPNNDTWIIAFRDPFLKQDGFVRGSYEQSVASTVKRQMNNVSRFLMCCTIYRGLASGDITIPSDFMNGINVAGLDGTEEIPADPNNTKVVSAGRAEYKNMPIFYRNRGIVDEISIKWSPEVSANPETPLVTHPILTEVSNSTSNPSNEGNALTFSALTPGVASVLASDPRAVFLSYVRFAMVYTDDESYNSSAQLITAGGGNLTPSQYRYEYYMVPFHMDDYPIIKQKYNLVVDYFKNTYGIDLKAVARGI